MKLKDTIGQVEQRFLQTICELANGRPKASVAYADVQRHLALSDSEADHCCDFWARHGAVAWSTPGRIALTYIGLARAERLGGNGDHPTSRERLP